MSQYFCGCHDGYLHIVGYRNGRRQNRYNRLPRSYISLQQAVHGKRSSHIILDFFDHFFLGIGQFKIQTVRNEFYLGTDFV